MYYFVYDLDETLAEIHTIFYFLMSLKLKDIIIKSEPDTYTDNKILFDQLEYIYREFVKKVLDIEKSNNPLGILRPGILGIMKQLENLREEGKVKNVIIYSNNGHLENLEFIKDLIVLYLMPSTNNILKLNNNNLNRFIDSGILISDLIHWGHLKRNSERRASGLIKTGYATKTWSVLRNIVTDEEGKTKAAKEDFIPSNVFFFDDIRPKHLISYILRDNYYQVPSYDFKASVDRVADLYEASFGKILDEINMSLFIRLVEKYIIGKLPNNGNLLLKRLVDRIKSLTTDTVSKNTLVPTADEGIDMMQKAINKVKGIVGGKRRFIKNKTRKRRLRSNRNKS
jgi:hypothetical protein